MDGGENWKEEKGGKESIFGTEYEKIKKKGMERDKEWNNIGEE